jgi:predicted nucleic acid-binding protein
VIIVLDCNAAIEIVLKRKKGTAFRDLVETSEKTITSEFFKIETANVLRKYYKGKYIKKEECFKLLELSESLIDEFVPISENNVEALSEAIRLDYSAYDMLYLTLARRTGALLITLDQTLNNIAKREGIEVM